MLVENCWVIRSVRTKPDGQQIVAYYETPSTWNASPVEATIFRNYEAGAGHLKMYHDMDKAPRGWADGSKEIIDVVPMHGALTKGVS